MSTLSCYCLLVSQNLAIPCERAETWQILSELPGKQLHGTNINTLIVEKMITE